MRWMIQGIAVALFTVGLCVLPASAADGKKLIIFIAGKPSHEFGGHEHNAGCELLAKLLNESMSDKLTTKVYHNGWPTDPTALDGADAIVMYCDGGSGHMALKQLPQIDALAKKGVGIGCIHYAVEPADEKVQNNGRAEFLKWIGGYFETGLSINPHWKADFTALPDHAVASGVHPLSTHDEWYYHMRFRPDMAGVTPILSSIPPPGLKGSDAAHNGNEEARAPKVPEHVVWVSESTDPAYNGQRGFGCTGGHVHWNWAQDDFRKAILNAIVWTAKIDVPKNGVETKRPTVAELLANMDKKNRPAEKTDAWIAKYIEDENQPLTK